MISCFYTASVAWCLTLSPEQGISESDLAALKTANADFHAKTASASNTAAIAKPATVEKNDSRRYAEVLIRAEARRIKAPSDYHAGQGMQLGIEGAEHNNDLSNAAPNISGGDQTGGVVALSVNKYNSNGINIYCQRENDPDWVLIGRATVSPYLDERPLLQAGKPDLRLYTAIYMSKEEKIGKYSNGLVVTCAP